MEEPRDGGGAVHDGGDGCWVAVEPPSRRGDTGSCGRECGARNLGEHGQRGDATPRGQAFRIELVGPRLPDLAEGYRDPPDQLAAGLLKRVEGQFVEGGKGGIAVLVAGHRTYPTDVNEIGFGKHAIILTAVIINLWVGGDYIESWFGHGWRTVFELLLILGYMVLILGITAPLPWRRKKDESERR